jgi:hypothetical protein
MKLGCPFCSIILLLIFILLSKDELANVNVLIIENNPFYGLSNAKIKAVEFTTDDNLINVKLEYAPQAFKIGSPEFFKATLSYKDTNEIALHADTGIVISKDGKEVFKESGGYSKPYVHTPNGIVLSSYKFQNSGQYVISVKVLGLNFMPVNPKQVNFATNVTHLNDKYLIQIGK